MPEHVLTAAKFYVGLIGVIAQVVAASTGAPVWIAVVAAVCTAIGVYLTPNATPAVVLPSLTVVPPTETYGYEGIDNGITPPETA